jgi:hypothetical protein
LISPCRQLEARLRNAASTADALTAATSHAVPVAAPPRGFPPSRQ